MAGRLKFLLGYFLSWVLFFELARAVFFITHWHNTAHLNSSTVFFSFIYGLRMDLSMSAYFLIPVCLFILASVFIPFFRRTITYKVYTGILLFLVLLILVADVEVFREWGFRIDTTPLKYLASPKEAWASVSHLPVFLYLFIFLVVYLACLFTFFKLIERLSEMLKQRAHKLITSLVLILFTVALIIPVRGGFQLTPMNQSIVYFSTDNFANQAAVNATWNLMYSLVSENSSTKNPYSYMPPQEAKAIVDSLYHSNGSNISILNTTRPNVILIIWESFTEKATHLSINGTEVTPYFNLLKKEGIYFNHAYASGDRTDKGLAAVLAGYPALPKTSIIRLPAKTRKLQTLGSVFNKQGYRSSFYYGGEPEFANIKSFLLQNSFDPIIDKSNFASRDLNSKWGAHDGVVADRVIKDLNNIQQPYFITWLTLSSHEPFETPVRTVFTGSDHTTLFLNSLHYTDSILYHFVERCKKLPSWNNTVLIIVADHGHPLPETGKKLDNFKIPILWVGGALKQKGVVYEKISSQLDIASTLTHQTIGPNNFFPFSKNYFDSTSANWAFFTFNDGFGFVDGKEATVYDNVGKRLLFTSPPNQGQGIKAGQAMQQFSFQDYVNK
jgi:phosphoglycerol transferase MdoB-like AlkP superfamily enzyme